MQIGWAHSCSLHLVTRDRTVGLQVLALVGEAQLETPVLLLYSVGSWLLLETRCLRDGAGAPCAVHNRTYTTACVCVCIF